MSLFTNHGVAKLMSKGPIVCAAVAGNPISHSLTPFLFNKVAQLLESSGHNITFHACEKINHNSLIDALAWGHAKMSVIAKEDEGADPGRREIWLSITSPLKHQLPLDSGAEWTIGEPMLASVNQMRHDGHVWKAANTDGAGLLMVAREFGFDFNLTDDLERPLLCMVAQPHVLALRRGLKQEEKYGGKKGGVIYRTEDHGKIQWLMQEMFVTMWGEDFTLILISLLVQLLKSKVNGLKRV